MAKYYKMRLYEYDELPETTRSIIRQNLVEILRGMKPLNTTEELNARAKEDLYSFYGDYICSKEDPEVLEE